MLPFRESTTFQALEQTPYSKKDTVTGEPNLRMTISP